MHQTIVHRCDDVFVELTKHAENMLEIMQDNQ